MPTPERKTLWGTFPLPDGEEILEAWNQIARRTNNTAAMDGTVPNITDLGDRVRELSDACPALEKMVAHLGAITAGRLAESSLSDEDRLAVAYGRGYADMLELFATIAMNREAEAIVPELPDFPDSPQA